MHVKDRDLSALLCLSHLCAVSTPGSPVPLRMGCVAGVSASLCWQLALSCTRKAGEIKGSIRASCKKRREKMVPADIIGDLLPASYLSHIKIKQ